MRLLCFALCGLLVLLFCGDTSEEIPPYWAWYEETPDECLDFDPTPFSHNFVFGMCPRTEFEAWVSEDHVTLWLVWVSDNVADKKGRPTKNVHSLYGRGLLTTGTCVLPLLLERRQGHAKISVPRMGTNNVELPAVMYVTRTNISLGRPNVVDPPFHLDCKPNFTEIDKGLAVRFRFNFPNHTRLGVFFLDATFMRAANDSLNEGGPLVYIMEFMLHIVIVAVAVPVGLSLLAGVVGCGGLAIYTCRRPPPPPEQTEDVGARLLLRRRAKLTGSGAPAAQPPASGFHRSPSDQQTTAPPTLPQAAVSPEPDRLLTARECERSVSARHRQPKATSCRNRPVLNALSEADVSKRRRRGFLGRRPPKKKGSTETALIAP
ncbi:hypothetical protein M3Y99_00516800 [Aphelenchoides fujianensis]|nr:hypothetical protein M3Y99_00516800 [Aphelenchoides fujianensis]